MLPLKFGIWGSGFAIFGEFLCSQKGMRVNKKGLKLVEKTRGLTFFLWYVICLSISRGNGLNNRN
jgi:hypothetical protein